MDVLVYVVQTTRQEGSEERLALGRPLEEEAGSSSQESKLYQAVDTNQGCE